MNHAAKTQPTSINLSSVSGPKTQLTLLDHLYELRSRLFWIVLGLIIASAFGYVIQKQIIAFLLAPLGGQQLVYLTPIGGFNFIFRISLYFGLVVTIPIVMYHLYRFLEPLMQVRLKRSVFFYLFFSVALAAGGMAFAYFAGLPAAMHFLTGFNIQQVTAMLTVDSYLAFVLTYLIGFAALFQIPLLLLVLNSITPLPPKKLMGLQRFVVLAAFIVAAIISPTPDITNQAILAGPIIGMYQVGIGLVWLQSGMKKKQRPASPPSIVLNPGPAVAPATTAPLSARVASVPAMMATGPSTSRRRPVMDVAMPRDTIRSAATRSAPRTVRPAAPTALRPAALKIDRPMVASSSQPRLSRMRGSIDGIMSY